MSGWRLGVWIVGGVGLGLGAGLVFGGHDVVGFIVAGGGAAALLIMTFRRSNWRRGGGVTEPDRIEDLDTARRNELVRGTSMHLRDMKYRYSIRYDRSDRAPFTTDVNTVRLGFVPVVILDNRSDRQGSGYVAFPYDGRRWRGPGLPCGGGPEEAVAHASRYVSPLEEDDEGAGG